MSSQEPDLLSVNRRAEGVLSNDNKWLNKGARDGESPKKKFKQLNYVWNAFDTCVANKGINFSKASSNEALQIKKQLNNLFYSPKTSVSDGIEDYLKQLEVTTHESYQLLSAYVEFYKKNEDKLQAAILSRYSLGGVLKKQMQEGLQRACGIVETKMSEYDAAPADKKDRWQKKERWQDAKNGFLTLVKELNFSEKNEQILQGNIDSIRLETSLQNIRNFLVENTILAPETSVGMKMSERFSELSQCFMEDVSFFPDDRDFASFITEFTRAQFLWIDYEKRPSNPASGRTTPEDSSDTPTSGDLSASRDSFFSHTSSMSSHESLENTDESTNERKDDRGCNATIQGKGIG